MQVVKPRGVSRPIVPKEHGVWAVLYGAFLAGVGVAGRVTVPVVLLLVVVTALALANGPVCGLLRPTRGGAASGERRNAFVWLTIYGFGALVGLIPLLALYRMTFLVPLGMAAACLFVLRAFLVREGEDRSLAGELIGTTGLTLVGPTAHAVAVGGVEPIGAVLWLLLALFFASGVFYVRMRVRVTVARRRGAAEFGPARWWCLLYHAFLLVVVPALAALQLVSWGVLLAFAPALWRAAAGLRRPDAPLNLKRLGWSEVALTLAFVALLIVAF